jgi:protein SCO1/2
MTSGLQRRRFVLAATALAACLAGCQPTRQEFKSMDVSGAPYGRDFALRDPDGRLRRLADFEGRAVLLVFGFTQCPDVCPTALIRATAVREMLGPLAQQLQVLFVTVDPERDTPELLRNYTAAFHPDFLGLHADAEGTAELARAFKIHYAKVPTGSSYTMDHSTLSYVFDARGRLRLAVRHDQSAEELAQDIRTLLAA